MPGENNERERELIPRENNVSIYDYVRRFTAGQPRLEELPPGQRTSLEQLLPESDSLLKDAEKLEALRREINDLLYDEDATDGDKIRSLYLEAKDLEKKLHDSATSLDERVRDIVDTEQHARMTGFEVETYVTEEAPLPLSVEVGQPWHETYPLSFAVGNGADTKCAYKDWQFQVPLLYLIDTSQGASGGYTLDIRTDRGKRELEVTPIILQQVYHVGYKIRAHYCARPWWGETGRLEAYFSLYGKPVAPPTV